MSSSNEWWAPGEQAAQELDRPRRSVLQATGRLGPWLWAWEPSAGGPRTPGRTLMRPPLTPGREVGGQDSRCRASTGPCCPQAPSCKVSPPLASCRISSGLSTLTLGDQVCGLRHPKRRLRGRECRGVPEGPSHHGLPSFGQSPTLGAGKGDCVTCLPPRVHMPPVTQQRD